MRLRDWLWIFFSSSCSPSIFLLRPCIRDIIASRAASVWSGVCVLESEAFAVSLSAGRTYSFSRSTARCTVLRFLELVHVEVGEGVGPGWNGLWLEHFLSHLQTCGEITRIMWLSGLSFVDVSSAAMVIRGSFYLRSRSSSPRLNNRVRWIRRRSGGEAPACGDKVTRSASSGQCNV